MESTYKIRTESDSVGVTEYELSTAIDIASRLAQRAGLDDPVTITECYDDGTSIELYAYVKAGRRLAADYDCSIGDVIEIDHEFERAQKRDQGAA